DLALARALELAVHPAAGTVIVIAAILILLSHQNLEYMSGPRILQALAVDGFMARRAQDTGKGGNPVVAILVTWLTAVGLILIGGFEFLLLLSVFFFVPLYLALVAGILILRKREPDTDRPYIAWGHPYSTYVCLAGWILITLFQAYVERQTALYAVAMVAVSWPVYRYLARK
ncbi:MAG: amino acid permease, partial [Woeseia sp.]